MDHAPDSTRSAWETNVCLRRPRWRKFAGTDAVGLAGRMRRNGFQWGYTASLCQSRARWNGRVIKMPRPMRVRIFTDTRAAAVEAQINAWLNELGSATIIKMETVVAAVADKPADGPHPCIVVTVWYEPPLN
jgi:hypothetical protein